MKKLDIVLLSAVFLLLFFGMLIIFDASSFIAFRDFGDKYHYIKDQAMWLVIGLTALTFFSFFDYHKFYGLSLPLLIVAILLLIAVLIPGVGISVLGARRWINFHLFVLQPAEFVKLTLAIYLAAWFYTKEKGRSLAFFGLLGFVMLLVMLEPDMGTAMIIFSECIVLYFLEGAKIIYFLYIAPVVALIGFILVKIEPYRAARLATFLNSDHALETSSYHVRQILIALGTGGVTGVGLGNS